MQPALEVADILRHHGAAYRAAEADSLSNTQRRVMAAIEACRTATLGGHVERCEDCGETRIAYNSCVSAQLGAHSKMGRGGTVMVSTINEVDTMDERSLELFEA